MAKSQNAKSKGRNRKTQKPVWVPDVKELAESCIANAYDLINRYECGEEDDYGNVVDEEILIERLDEIHAEFDELVQDGWVGYRDTMDALSNRLWQVGVAWPQHLQYWSLADVVLPEDLKKEITGTCLYRDDLLAIREYADDLKCRFKDAVHLLVEHARKTVKDFPQKEKPSRESKKKTGNGVKTKVSRRR